MQNLYSNEIIEGIVYTINTATGEVVYPAIKKNRYIISTKGYVGMDSLWIKDCTNRFQLIKAVSLIDSYYDKPVNCDMNWVIESMDEGITSHERALIMYLIDSINVWNHVYTTTTDINCVVDKRRVKQCFDRLLAKGVLWSVDKDKLKYHIQVNPLVAWKGGYNFRDNAIEQHYSPYRA
jgi:hypothetical protein